MQRFFDTLLVAACLAGVTSGPVHAQYSPPPQAYSLTEFTALFGIPMTRQIVRDGSKILLETNTPPMRAGSKGTHVRTLWDLAKHVSFTWDLIETDRPCGPATFDGDGNWGDPFLTSAQMTGELLKSAKKSGTESVAGIAADVYTANTPAARGRVWIEPKYGLVMRLEVAEGKGPVETKYEVKEIHFSRPAAAAFALPTVCAAAARKPLPKTESQIRSEVTGGHAADYLDNSGIPDAEAMKSACSVIFRVVREGTLEPVRSGFQVAVAMGDVENHPPQWEIGMGTDGRAHFNAGEVTSQLRDGILRLPQPSKDFEIYLHMINGEGGGSSLLHRQCFHPQQVLLATVPAAKGKPDDAPAISHWLWVKSGPLAAVPDTGGASAPATPPAAAAPRPSVPGRRVTVTSVRLRLEPPSYTGPCPSPIRLVADLTTNGPGTVWYSFLAGAVANKSGPTEDTVVFEAAGTKTVTLSGVIRATPRVPETRVLAAMQDEEGRHGPQTTRSEDIPYNRTCQAR